MMVRQPASPISTDLFGVQTSGGAVSYFLVKDDGKVGIGTASPGSVLDVKGTIRLSGSSSGYVGFSPAAAAGSTTYTLPAADGSSGQALSTNASGTLSWASYVVAGDLTAYALLAGRAGGQTLIGGTGPKEFLTLKSTSAVGTTDYISFGVGTNGGTEALRIIHDGKIGIGTATPNSLLDVHGDLTVTGALGLYSFTAGETLAQYDVVYAYCEAGTSGRLKKASNAAESTARVIGVVVSNADGIGNPATIVMAGVYKMTFDSTPAVTDFGKPVFLSDTAGKVTLTAPGAGTVLLRVGFLVGYGSVASEVSIHIGDEFQQ
jgi:hypothetical protein